MANPVKFDGHNLVLAEDQKEYLPLPVHVSNDREGTTVCCWELTAEELEQVKKTGRVFIEVWTFNRGFPPMRVGATFPLDGEQVPG